MQNPSGKWHKTGTSLTDFLCSGKIQIRHNSGKWYISPSIQDRGLYFTYALRSLWRKEGMLMVTYEALFTYTLVIIGIINLILQIKKK